MTSVISSNISVPHALVRFNMKGPAGARGILFLHASRFTLEDTY